MSFFCKSLWINSPDTLFLLQVFLECHFQHHEQEDLQLLSIPLVSPLLRYYGLNYCRSYDRTSFAVISSSMEFHVLILNSINRR
jgi:hypothetical protein